MKVRAACCLPNKNFSTKCLVVVQGQCRGRPGAGTVWHMIWSTITGQTHSILLRYLCYRRTRRVGLFYRGYALFSEIFGPAEQYYQLSHVRSISRFSRDCRDEGEGREGERRRWEKDTGADIRAPRVDRAGSTVRRGERGALQDFRAARVSWRAPRSHGSEQKIYVPSKTEKRIRYLFQRGVRHDALLQRGVLFEKDPPDRRRSALSQRDDPHMRV